MKFTINGYEVEIKAKRTVGSKRMNKEDTMDFVNYISMLSYVASERYAMMGADALAKDADKTSQEFYTVLAENGAYRAIICRRPSRVSPQGCRRPRRGLLLKFRCLPGRGAHRLWSDRCIRCTEPLRRR